MMLYSSLYRWTTIIQLITMNMFTNSYWILYIYTIVKYLNSSIEVYSYVKGQCLCVVPADIMPSTPVSFRHLSVSLKPEAIT